MVDKISKALNKLSEKDRKKIKQILLKIESHDFEHFDMKKLKSYDSIYRIRTGVYRIIFQIKNDDSIKVLEVGKKSDDIYKGL